MKKMVLDLEEEFDYQVIGICSSLVDYRLAWEVNQLLMIQLKRTSEDYIKRNKKGEKLSTHSLYEDFNEEENYQYLIVKNKNKGKFLVAELELIDYFLLIQDNNIDIEEVSKKLRKIQMIQTAVSIDTDEHRSFESLVF